MNGICIILVALGCLCSSRLDAQRYLRITSAREGSDLNLQVYEGDKVAYRLRGKLFFRKAVVSAFGDTAMVFRDGTSVRFDRMAALRLNKNVHIVSTASRYLAGLCVMFVALSAVNSGVSGTGSLADPRVLLAGGGLLTASWLVKRLDYRKVRMNRYKVLTVIDIPPGTPGAR